MDSTTKVLLAVGGLLAAATALWATASGVLSGKEPDPVKSGAEQTNQGQGTSPKPDLRAQAAEKVAACEKLHQMAGATHVIDDNAGYMEFQTCEWPPSQFADADGYWSIRMNQEKGPGDSEATGMSLADRIYGPCQVFEVTYDYGHMGESRHLKPFTVARGAVAITTYDGGEAWTGNRSELPFYQDRNEAVVLTSGHYGLVSIRCA
jgi:hypothetical protein